MHACLCRRGKTVQNHTASRAARQKWKSQNASAQNFRVCSFPTGERKYVPRDESEARLRSRWTVGKSRKNKPMPKQEDEDREEYKQASSSPTACNERDTSESSCPVRLKKRGGKSRSPGTGAPGQAGLWLFWRVKPVVTVTGYSTSTVQRSGTTQPGTYRTPTTKDALASPAKSSLVDPRSRAS